MLSVWPTSFATRLPDLGSHILMTRSGEPDAITVPYGSVAKAYSDAFGPAASGGLRVSSGSALLEAEARSHSLIVRSKEPEANHCCSRLQDIRNTNPLEQYDLPVCQATDIIGMGAYNCRLV